MNTLPIDTLQITPTFDEFIDEPNMTAAEKRRVLLDWRAFISQGFKQQLFSQELYHFLYQNCAFIAHYDRERFWAYYFKSGIDRLHAFIGQFGGNKSAAEFGTADWLSGHYTDLKLAMCREMSLIYQPLCQILDNLSRQYEEMVQLWDEFAQSNDIRANIPPQYILSENTRHLLAFASHIAIEHQQRPAPPEILQLPLFVGGDYAPVN
jgi:hypothetical protein